MLLILEKTFSFWEERRLKLGVFIIMIIVALLSFGLGYMMAKDSTRTPIIIENR